MSSPPKTRFVPSLQAGRSRFEVAAAAVANAADSVSSPALTQAVFDCEKQLDILDRQMDECFATVLAESSPQRVRELLACMKCMIDLERIGDLISSFVGRCRVVAPRLEMQDISDLINMNSHLESMLNDVLHAFRARDLSRAIGVLRSDREIDRIRNLIFLPHLEDQARLCRTGQHSRSPDGASPGVPAITLRTSPKRSATS